MHLGNLKFKSGTESNTESSDIVDLNLSDKIARLLGINKVDLNDALIKRTIFAHGDSVVKPLSKEQANESRNSFVKGIYGKLFIWIVNKINAAIYKPKTSSKRSIGVLDIFGFENFNVNSFEQLCINYANENLQQFFIKHIFKLEQEYYTKEGINWSNISFIDNQDVLDMIGIKPLNLLSLIDEESKFPKGTDFTMLAKLHNQHGKHASYLRPKSEMTPSFGVQHFAGSVFYDVPGFLEKNRDSFSQDLKNMIGRTENDLLKTIFADDFKNEQGKKQVTLSSQFRSSLDLLMKTLSACHPFFVRCIKPNENKKPQIFDRALCTRQLRYSGMMETAKIRQAGYPIRYTYKEFVDRFRHLGKAIQPSSKGDCKANTARICTEVFKNNEDFQLGHTKIFLKHQDSENLENLRSTILEKYLQTLQKVIRGWIHRRRFKKLRAAAIVFQKYFRARGYRTKYLKIKTGYQRLQAKIRTRELVQQYQAKRNAIMRLQAISKGYIVRNTQHKFGTIVAIVRQRRLDEKKLLAQGVKNYKNQASDAMQQRLNEANKSYIAQMRQQDEDNNKAKKLVDDVFDFLKDSGSASSAADIRESQEFIDNLEKKSTKQVEEFEDDLSEYNFRKYAATYFAHNTNPQYSKKPLKSALHDLPTPDDIIAAQALWITILRFMGDYPEPKFENSIKDNEPVMSKVSHTLSRSFANRKEYKEILKHEQHIATMKKSERQRLLSMTLKRKSKLLEDVKQGLVEDNYAAESYNEWLFRRRTNNMEKLHFIIGHGILRPELRDEIFCQICKQLTSNHIKSSYARGWILLSLCVGCFPPSERFVNYLRSFIRSGPPGYAPYCEGRLNRTFVNGARLQPPSWLELMASKNKDPINLNIQLMDGSVHNVEVDSATTSEELCKNIAQIVNLKDTFGFSLFISVYDKIMSLGCDREHVMDAISQCEQYAKEQGQHEKDSPWRLLIRKEIFTPWHDPSKDFVATNLIYHQITRGLKVGEYTCPAEADVASLIALQYYVENGAQMKPQILHTRIGEYLPIHLAKKVQNNVKEWEMKIVNAFNNLVCVKKRLPANEAKQFLVTYAKSTWPILFSKFYEAAQISGPELPKKNMIIALNWTGLFMIDDQEQILAELTFADITFVTFERDKIIKFILKTVRKEEYVFHIPDAESLCNIIQFILDGLKKRSIYCVATQDYKHATNAESFLQFKKGDLITLKNGLTGENLINSSWGYGECNNKIADFPTDHVYILPTLSKPPGDILVAFKKEDVFKPKEPTTAVMTTIQRMKLYTLSHYAEEHFRAGRRLTVAKNSILTAARRSSREELWKYTNEPIFQPLLQKLLSNDEAGKAACNMFTSILKYMGDLPAPKAKFSNEYTDEIFTNPLKMDLLQDELYCQLMRQLTFNRLSLSEERGWELMYLATGLFVPSAVLLTELQKFLKSRTHPFAEPCLRRLQRTQKVGPRKFPPFSVEVDAIQHKSMEIFHKIYFPDDTDEAFQVDSMTRACDLAKSIEQRLGLETTEGFSLFVAISDRVFSIPDKAFFYDFLGELISWIRTTKASWGSTYTVMVKIYFKLSFFTKYFIRCGSNSSTIPYILPEKVVGEHRSW